MRVTRLGAPIPLLTMATGGIGATGPSGYVYTSNGSNATYWGENIARITANGSNANTLVGPFVNIAAGANVTLATASNTLTITSVDPGVSGITSNGSNSLVAAVNLQAGAGIALGVTAQTITITNIGGVSGGGSGAAAGYPFKRTVRIGDGNKTTTSATKTPIDSTNLAYLTHTLEIGDVVRCTLNGTAKHSLAGNVVGFDFEVDQPTSANTYVAAAAENGCGTVWAEFRQPVAIVGVFTATEAGVHGFRPVWLTSAATATLSNATSGGDDVAITFVVELLGQPAA